MTESTLHARLDNWVDAHFDEQTRFVQALVRVPSDTPPGNNTPPDPAAGGVARISVTSRESRSANAVRPAMAPTSMAMKAAPCPVGRVGS